MKKANPNLCADHSPDVLCEVCTHTNGIKLEVLRDLYTGHRTYDPETHVVVPREPTDEIWARFYANHCSGSEDVIYARLSRTRFFEMFRGMIAAAEVNND